MSIFDYFKVYLNPKFFLMNDPYSSELNKHILSNLSNAKMLSQYYMDVGGIVLWASNYPYAYATFEGFRPSRLTIYRLRKAVLINKLKGELQPPEVSDDEN